MSGHHANIEKWRHEESLKRTLLYRPDLLKSAVLSEQDHKDLARLKEELKSQVPQEEAESI